MYTYASIYVGDKFLQISFSAYSTMTPPKIDFSHRPAESDAANRYSRFTTIHIMYIYLLYIYYYEHMILLFVSNIYIHVRFVKRVEPFFHPSYPTMYTVVCLYSRSSQRRDERPHGHRTCSQNFIVFLFNFCFCSFLFYFLCFLRSRYGKKIDRRSSTRVFFLSVLFLFTHRIRLALQYWESADKIRLPCVYSP